jgi:hypothetical protein
MCVGDRFVLDNEMHSCCVRADQVLFRDPLHAHPLAASRTPPKPKQEIRGHMTVYEAAVP